MPRVALIEFWEENTRKAKSFLKNKIIDSSSSSSGASLLHHELPHDRHPRRGTQREVMDGLSTATATVF
ncbi:hypothetical protein F2Q69_00023770 [Brassica cretica]|uniref:Uncharacterized protein n=1 Tax=Brassica cretica TaxID=69181 RepID=A0A8S9QKJ4_BRACR|nr:hypothetical protein F2Q69_00023770 [Brassica cretica]